MIGQTKLLTELNKYSLESLPKTLLFIGPQGCGKHTVAAYISNKFNLSTVEISSEVTAEDLIEFNQEAIPTLYLIDLTLFTLKQQNQFLKFIEEPYKNTYIILLANSEVGILSTVLNRCTKYYFEDYTVAELREYADGYFDLIYHICKTPGQLQNISESNIINMYNYCYDLLNNLKTINYAKMLSTAVLINYKEDYDKYDFTLFFNTLLYISKELYKQILTPAMLITYKLTAAYVTRLQFSTLNKEHFVLNYLTNLWEATR